MKDLFPTIIKIISIIPDEFKDVDPEEEMKEIPFYLRATKLLSKVCEDIPEESYHSLISYAQKLISDNQGISDLNVVWKPSITALLISTALLSSDTYFDEVSTFISQNIAFFISTSHFGSFFSENSERKLENHGSERVGLISLFFWYRFVKKRGDLCDNETIQRLGEIISTCNRSDNIQIICESLKLAFNLFNERKFEDELKLNFSFLFHALLQAYQNPVFIESDYLNNFFIVLQCLLKNTKAFTKDLREVMDFTLTTLKTIQQTPNEQIVYQTMFIQGLFDTLQSIISLDNENIQYISEDFNFCLELSLGILRAKRADLLRNAMGIISALIWSKSKDILYTPEIQSELFTHFSEMLHSGSDEIMAITSQTLGDYFQNTSPESAIMLFSGPFGDTMTLLNQESPVVNIRSQCLSKLIYSAGCMLKTIGKYEYLHKTEENNEIFGKFITAKHYYFETLGNWAATIISLKNIIQDEDDIDEFMSVIGAISYGLSVIFLHDNDENYKVSFVEDSIKDLKNTMNAGITLMKIATELLQKFGVWDQLEDDISTLLILYGHMLKVDHENSFSNKRNFFSLRLKGKTICMPVLEYGKKIPNLKVTAEALEKGKYDIIFPD